MTEPTATVATTDSTFAAALMTRGARLLEWRLLDDGVRVEWTLDRVEAGFIDDFKSGRDRFRDFHANFKMLRQMAGTLKQPQPDINP